MIVRTSGICRVVEVRQPQLVDAGHGTGNVRLHKLLKFSSVSSVVTGVRLLHKATR